MDNIFNMRSFTSNDIHVVIALIFGLLITASLAFFIAGKVKPEANLGELKARTKSWWVMSVVFLLATMFINEISYIAIAFLSFVAFDKQGFALQQHTHKGHPFFS